MSAPPASEHTRARVTLLTQPDCGLCEQAKTVLGRLVDQNLITVAEVDLASPDGRALAVRHGVLFAPGVLIEGQAFSYGRLSEKRLRRHLARLSPPPPGQAR
jgi:hypothetical protein